MNRAMLVVGIILLAIITFGVVNIMQNYQTGNELDYYLLRETTEAAMTDAVDVGYFRLSGQVRMDKEKFVESFVRRFSQNVTPPKVSILVKSETAASVNDASLGITNKIDAILETNYYSNEYVTKMTRAGELDYSDVDR